jgi:hypothetical protein
MRGDHDIARLAREAGLQRLQDLSRELADDRVPRARRDELCVEYAELAIAVFEAMLQDDDCDPDLREELRNQVTSWRDDLEAIYTAAAKRRLSIRWRGTENADIELDGFMIAELWHAPTGWTLTPAGDELGLPSEWVAPPGLAGPATDHASRRALARVADHIARISPRPGEDDC